MFIHMLSTPLAKFTLCPIEWIIWIFPTLLITPYIAETAKANNLKPYDYFEYLLEEIPKHMEDTDRSFLEDLLPWSENLPAHIRK